MKIENLKFKIALFPVFFIIILLGYKSFNYFSFLKTKSQNFTEAQKRIILNDNGFSFDAQTPEKTIADFLEKNKLILGEHDRIIPDINSPLLPGMNISIKRALKIKIISDGKTSEVYTLENSVAGAIWENKINLGEDDIVKPGLDYALRNGDKIEIIRVDIGEEIFKKDIPFKITSNEDDKLSWRIKKITQKGEKGIKEITYKIVSHNGKEISRKILNENIIKDPVTEIITQGTYVKIGKTHTGAASWYAYTGTMAAANPWLPMGSFVRVVNTENGKSVIVKINDRGPFGNGRIIDLDKVAFAKIAPLGAGVANVRMEVIVN